MTEKIHDLFIDNESVGSYNDFTIFMPYPITVEEDERCYLRLKDFQQLNSFYNVSNDLENNTFSVIRTNRVYSRTPSGTEVEYFNPTNLFQTSGTYIYKPIINPSWNATTHLETLTPSVGDFSIKLYDPTITTNYTSTPITSVKISNIFSTTISANYMTLNPEDYFIFYNFTTPTSGRFINQITFTIENVSSIFVPPDPIYITIKVWSSVDGITWTENAIGINDSPSIGYNGVEWTVSTKKSRTITLISTDTYSYHKVSFTTQGFANPATDLKSKIRFFRINLTRIPSFDETYVDTPTTFNHTIEDGAYSISNLNSYLNYLLKLNISPNLSFTTSYPAQPFLVAQNKEVLIWTTAEPTFIYSPADRIEDNYKIEIVFNTILKKMLGWTSNPIIFKNNTSIEAPNYLNLINFKKIVLTSSLQLTTKPYTFLNKTYTKATGIGDIFAWVSKDIAPFSYINWQNPTDAKIEIDDKLITKITFKILNEYLQVLNDMPSCNFHFQIIIDKK